MAGAFGVGDEIYEQRVAVGAVGRQRTELIAPQPKRPPRAQFVRGEADDIGALSWLWNKLKVMQPDFLEGQLSRNHGQPTS